MTSIDDAYASVPSRAKRARAIWGQYPGMFERFCGGMPAGVFCAACQWESDGKMDAPGSATLGEIGVFQVSAHTEVEYSVPNGVRAGVEGNFFLAGQDYNAEAKRLQLRYPQLFSVISTDLWMCARLVFAVGRGGAFKIIDTVKPHYSSANGGVYSQLVDWSKSSGGMALGSQTAAKVAYRIQAIPLLFTIASQAGLPISPGEPTLIAPPPSITRFSLPKDLQGKLTYVQSSTLPVIAVALLGAYLLFGRNA